MTTLRSASESARAAMAAARTSYAAQAVSQAASKAGVAVGRDAGSGGGGGGGRGVGSCEVEEECAALILNSAEYLKETASQLGRLMTKTLTRCELIDLLGMCELLPCLLYFCADPLTRSYFVSECSASLSHEVEVSAVVRACEELSRHALAAVLGTLQVRISLDFLHALASACVALTPLLSLHLLCEGCC